MVCSASLQSQSADSMMPIHFRCAHRPLSCSQPEYNGLFMSCQMVDWICSSFPLTFFTFGAGFWLPGKWRLTGVAVTCSQIWPGDLLFHFMESHSGPGSTVGPRCIHVGEAADLSAVGGY